MTEQYRTACIARRMLGNGYALLLQVSLEQVEQKKVEGEGENGESQKFSESEGVMVQMDRGKKDLRVMIGILS